MSRPEPTRRTGSSEPASVAALRRPPGSFAYGIRVPGDVDGAGIQARLADGVLTVTLPKSGQPARRSIEIEVAGE
ncbi:Hsp20/alpha crystallin family protein [Streptacidiphilus sp. MAP5-3]|jgi:HSP20 family molecular chaperone IbpA|uniref:Hsp20/alpha crystallin family protein n=1 Tax=unclassified Streptacidiphilus TaxID=2643834 RepID=UPI003517432B